MSKGQYDPSLNDALLGDFKPEELADHRRKSQCPEGIVVGSNEYWKWWREQNRERMRLYQKRAYLKKRKLALAFQKYDEQGLESVEAALAEIDEQIAILREVNSHNVAETRKKATVVKAQPNPVEVDHIASRPDEIPFVREMAEIYHIDYDTSLAIMTRDDYRGDDTFREVLGLPKE